MLPTQLSGKLLSSSTRLTCIGGSKALIFFYYILHSASSAVSLPASFVLGAIIFNGGYRGG